LLFNSFSYKDKVLFTDEVNFIIGNNFLITVSGYHADNRKPSYPLFILAMAIIGGINYFLIGGFEKGYFSRKDIKD